MKMVDMKKNERQKKDKGIVAVKERYPFNLKICLYSDELQKLGVKPSDVKVGSKVKLVAECTVVTTKEDISVESTEQTISLQIQKLGLDFDKSAYDSAWEEATNGK